MEGVSAPPLVGETFLSDWGGKSLANLVDKIQKTMPYDHPATLSRSQSTDLAAYVLQSGKFPAGPAELSDSALAQIAFPAVRKPAAPASAGGISLLPPEGNLAELMRSIAFPNANIIFNVQLHDPGKEPVKKLSSNGPFDYVEWGSTIYPGWQSIELAAMALTETAPLLSTPGRRCQNGKPAPVDRADWKQYVNDMAEVGRLARRTAQERNFEAFVDVSEKLNEACLNCHRVYRDRGGIEGRGALRCQPPAPAPAK
jgi:hypothetical protein